GRRAIYHCAELGHEACAKILLEYNASLEMTMSKRGESLMLLHAAAHNGHSGMVRLIMNTGSVEKNQIDDMKNTPLMVASSMGRSEEVADLLLEQHGDTEIQGEKGMTALAQAARTNNTESLQILLSRGADKESRDDKGRTPLMHAAKKEARDTLTRLLDAGCDVEAKDAKGKTALFHA
ncbi:ankyrin, partial [Phaeosphaeriaceae sp. SRC1lsM3a]